MDRIELDIMLVNLAGDDGVNEGRCRREIKNLLAKLTTNPISAVFAGALVTGVNSL